MSVWIKQPAVTRVPDCRKNASNHHLSVNEVICEEECADNSTVQDCSVHWESHTLLWNVKGMVHSEFMPSDATIISEKNCETTGRLKA
jgi:hypothetical protein